MPTWNIGTWRYLEVGCVWTSLSWNLPGLLIEIKSGVCKHRETEGHRQADHSSSNRDQCTKQGMLGITRCHSKLGQAGRCLWSPHRWWLSWHLDFQVLACRIGRGTNDCFELRNLWSFVTEALRHWCSDVSLAATIFLDHLIHQWAPHLPLHLRMAPGLVEESNRVLLER